MSYAKILEALRYTLGQVPGVDVSIIGQPTSVHGGVVIYSEYDATATDEMQEVKKLTYRTLHRVCVPWHNPQLAESKLAELVSLVPAAIDKDSTLVGRVNQVEIESAGADYHEIGGNNYRTADFYSEATEYVAYGIKGV